MYAYSKWMGVLSAGLQVKVWKYIQPFKSIDNDFPLKRLSLYVVKNCENLYSTHETIKM